MPSIVSERDLRLGCLVVNGDLQSPLPLEQTTVAVQIQGPVASVVVSQRFSNPLTEPAELEYLFPLPHEAALTDFLIKIGPRSVRADLQELVQARQAYEEARSSGRRAGLLEQRRPNLFAVSLVNILPGETILAEIRYQERVRFSEDGYEFVFPMGINRNMTAPRNPLKGKASRFPWPGRARWLGCWN